MTEIEVSFPLTVCKDILEFQDDQKWLLYKASVSHRTPGEKTGSVRARVVSEEAGDMFVDLVFTFPRCNPKSFASKGKFCLRIEGTSDASEIRVSENPESSESLNDPVFVADDASGCQPSGKNEIDPLGPETPGKKSARGRKPKTETVQVPVFENDTNSRPSRRKGKPTRFKDYDTDLDGIRRCRHSTEDEEYSHSDGTYDTEATTGSVSRTSAHGSASHGGEMQSSLAGVVSGSKKKRKRYDKLIRNLAQASQQAAESGFEIQSILSSIKASFGTEAGLGADGQRSENDASLIQEPPALTEAAGVTSAIDQGETATTEKATSKTSSSKQSASTRVTHPHLTYFPRKFPSSLLSTSSTLPVSSLGSLPGITNSGLQQQDSASNDKDAVKRVLDRYKKIQPAVSVGLLPLHRIEEDFVDDDGDPDYLPSEGDSDGSTKTRKTKRTAAKRKCSLSGTVHHVTGSSASGNQFAAGRTLQTLDASEVKAGFPFFIPQLRATDSPAKGVQNNMVLVGPFCVVGEGASACLKLVPEGERDNDPPRVLKGCLTLPSGIVKGLETTTSPILLRPFDSTEASPCSAIMDHDYTDINKPIVPGPKVLKTLAKPISLTQHISARVEKVEEGEGNSLVTISGHNAKVCPVPDSVYLTPKVNDEGMPVVDSLDEVMTDTLKRIEKYRESYRQAIEAKPTAPVCVSVADLPVSGETVLTVDGHIHNSKVPKLSGSGRRRSRRQFLEADTGGYTSLRKEHTPDTDILGGATVIAASVQGELQDVSMLSSGDGGDSVDLTQIALSQGLISANFYPGELVCLEDTDQQVLEISPSENADAFVEIENAAEVEASSTPLPDLKHCNYCLRLFPSTHMLLNHVKAVHSAYLPNPEHQEYLESLKCDARILCPHCSQYLSNVYKYRVHLANFHKDQTDAGSIQPAEVSTYQCEICMVHFQTQALLSLHAARKHKLQLIACPLCRECFVQESSRDVHVKDVHGDSGSQAFSCKDCGEVFQRRGLLVAHCKQVHREKNSDIPAVFEAVPLEQSYSENEQHICRLCNKGFRSPVKLSKHLETKHADFRGRVISIQEGKEHIKCTCCLARFQTLGEMQEHKRHVHTGAIPVHCVFCGSGYQSCAPMYNHIKNHHLQTQVFSCSVCSKQFPHRSALERHILSFHHMQSSAILEHLSSGAKQDIVLESPNFDDGSRVCCPYCQELFAKEVELVAHIVEGHHEQFPHSCHHCEQYFLTEKALHHHLQGSHNEVIISSLSPPQSPSPLILHWSLAEPAISDSLLSNQPLISNTFGSLDSEQENTSDTGVFDSLPAEAQNYIRSINNQGKRAMLIIDDGKGCVQQLSFSPNVTKPPSLRHASSTHHTEGLVYLEPIPEDNVTVTADPIAGEMQAAIENLVYGMDMPTEGKEEFQLVSVVETTDAQFVSSKLEAQGTELVVEEAVAMELDDVSTVTVETSHPETVTDSTEDFL